MTTKREIRDICRANDEKKHYEETLGEFPKFKKKEAEPHIFTSVKVLERMIFNIKKGVNRYGL